MDTPDIPTFVGLLLVALGSFTMGLMSSNCDIEKEVIPFLAISSVIIFLIGMIIIIVKTQGAKAK